MNTLKSRKALIKLRDDLKSGYINQTRKIIVCGGTGCVAGGSLRIYDALKEILEENGLYVALTLEKEPHDNEVGLKKSGCHGFC